MSIQMSMASRTNTSLQVKIKVLENTNKELLDSIKELHQSRWSLLEKDFTISYLRHQMIDLGKEPLKQIQ